MIPGAGDAADDVDQLAGDLVVEVKIEPHPFLRRVGNECHSDLPLTFAQVRRGIELFPHLLVDPCFLIFKRRRSGVSCAFLHCTALPRSQLIQEHSHTVFCPFQTKVSRFKETSIERCVCICGGTFVSLIQKQSRVQWWFGLLWSFQRT